MPELVIRSTLETPNLSETPTKAININIGQDIMDLDGSGTKDKGICTHTTSPWAD